MPSFWYLSTTRTRNIFIFLLGLKCNPLWLRRHCMLCLRWGVQVFFNFLCTCIMLTVGNNYDDIFPWHTLPFPKIEFIKQCAKHVLQLHITNIIFITGNLCAWMSQCHTTLNAQRLKSVTSVKKNVYCLHIFVLELHVPGSNVYILKIGHAHSGTLGLFLILAEWGAW